jgi:D-glycero-D-manno-heptose 1,7-bisphosphate phosphatase
MGRLRAAVFLDRDGTLNVKPREHEYVTSEHEFTWLPGAATGLARLARAGYLLTLVSNQRGVALGVLTRDVLYSIEKKMQRDLATHGCQIAAFRYCFHSNEQACNCRKPEPGLIIQLARELNIDLSRSWMVGDSDVDVLSGKNAGCRTALIGETGGETVPDLVAPTLAEASRLIPLPGSDAS